MKTLVVPAHVSRAFAAAAEGADPREACGLLLGIPGDVAEVTDWRATTNRATRDDRFAVDPGDLVAARREGRLLGVAHSHPRGPAEPSILDAAYAALWRPWVWLIRGQGGDQAAFTIDAEGRWSRVRVVSSAPP